MLNVSEMERILDGSLGMPPQDADMLASHMKHKKKQNQAFIEEVENKDIVGNFKSVYGELKRQNEIINEFQRRYGNA